MLIFNSLFKNHCWWGKILGAFFGYLMAHSTGALIGILIGNFFDRALCEHLARPFWQLEAEKSPALYSIFLEATFCLSGYLAKADGRVSEAEIAQAQAFMQKLHLNKKQKSSAAAHFQAGKKPHFNIDIIVTAFQKACGHKPLLLHAFLDMLYTMAKIDGLNEKKIKTLNELLIRLGLAPLNRQQHFNEEFNFNAHGNSNYNSSSQRSYRSHNSQQHNAYNHYNTVNNLDQAHTLLGTKPSSTQDEIKKAYRRLISRNHPDKLIARGASEEAIKNANMKTQAISKAYEQICASKNWS